MLFRLHHLVQCVDRRFPIKARCSFLNALLEVIYFVEDDQVLSYLREQRGFMLRVVSVLKICFEAVLH